MLYCNGCLVVFVRLMPCGLTIIANLKIYFQDNIITRGKKGKRDYGNSWRQIRQKTETGRRTCRWGVYTAGGVSLEILCIDADPHHAQDGTHCGRTSIFTADRTIIRKESLSRKPTCRPHLQLSTFRNVATDCYEIGSRSFILYPGCRFLTNPIISKLTVNFPMSAVTR